MPIIAEIKDIGKKFECHRYALWRELVDNCPSIKDIFIESDCGNNYHEFPAMYLVDYKDPNLKKIQSELDKKYGTRFIEEPIYKIVKEIREIILQAKSKKKKIEVNCLWR